LWYGRVPVERDQPVPVVFFRTAADHEVVREWLLSLSKDDRRTIGEDVKTVQFSWPVGKPLVDSLGGQRWEVRSRLKSRIARTLFTVHQQEIVLLHGFIKKDRKTPLGDLRLVKKRRALYLSGEANA